MGSPEIVAGARRGPDCKTDLGHAEREGRGARTRATQLWCVVPPMAIDMVLIHLQGRFSGYRRDSPAQDTALRVGRLDGIDPLDEHHGSEPFGGRIQAPWRIVDLRKRRCDRQEVVPNRLKQRDYLEVDHVVEEQRAAMQGGGDLERRSIGPRIRGSSRV
jgi:hypothetical protein